MSLESDVRSGHDFIAPSFMHVPDCEWSLGSAAVELAAEAGLILDPWQAFCLEHVLAERSPERPASFESAIIVPRQNGKGSILEALSLSWLFLTDIPLILHSAHEFKTAAEAFRRLSALIMRTPSLARRVRAVRTANGDQAIELHSGQRIRYIARSGASGRGFTGAKLILDEAYAIEAEEMAALLPTLATQPEAQLVYTSSAGMAKSSHLRALRDRGRSGVGSLCYLEWGGIGECPEGCTHALNAKRCALNDETLWAASNPGMGIRIPREYVASERESLSAQGFGRERLGWWDEPAAEDVKPIALIDWDACADPDSAIVGGKVWAVDLTPDGRKATIGVAGMRADGKPHGELIDSRHGTEWIVPRLVELIAKHDTRRIAVGERDHPGVILDPAGPAGGLLQPLRAAGIDPVVMGARDVGQACAWLQSAVQSRSVAHLGQEQVSMALAGAISRTVGDGLWAWGRIKSDRAQVDISPLVVITGALWGLSVSEARPAQAFFAALR